MSSELQKAIGAPSQARPAEKRVSALDGVRGFALVFVVVCHAANGYPGGWIGVDVFFVLSGYLITTLLMAEAQRSGRISLWGFYVRRALRLLPALAVAIILAVVLAATVAPAVWRRPTFSGLPWVVFYLGDIGRAVAPSDYGLGLLQHCWSLAVEEQFYAIWPFVTVLLITLRRRRFRPAVLVALAAAVALGLNLALVNHHANLAYFTPVGHSAGLLFGAALAFAMADPRVRRLAGDRGVTALAWVALAGIFAASFKLEMFGHQETAGIAVASLGTVIIIASVTGHGEGALARLMSFPALTWLGRRSYGVYLYHYIIFRALFPRVGASGSTEAGTASVFLVLAAIAVSLLAAEISFRVIEEPCLKLKERFVRAELTEPPAADSVEAVQPVDAVGAPIAEPATAAATRVALT